MRPLGSVAAVIGAVREDAQADVDAIEREAAAAIAGADVSPPTSAAAGRAPGKSDSEAALAAARDRARTRLSHEDWEDTRAALADREAWIADAIALGREQLLSRDARPYDARRATLAQLAAEGIARLPAGPIVIVVTASDATLLDDAWRSQIGRGDASAVTIVSRAIGGGCMVQSADGRAVFDNTYDARIERLQARWRAVLADIYERVTTDTPARKAPA